MNLVLEHNQLLTTDSQAQLPTTFYDDASEIIKLFRKQLNLHIKSSSFLIDEKELVDLIITKKQQGIFLVKKYQNSIVHENFYGIVQRFIGRIKQILQFTNNLAPTIVQFVTIRIKKVQIFLHKNIGTITIFQVVSEILNLIPTFYQNKIFSPQRLKTKVKQNKQNIPSVQKKVNTLDLILESYKRSFNLLSIIDIDESEYRSLFFSARDDRYKGTNYIQNDMKYRNRFIREQMERYNSNFQNYRQRAKKYKYVSNKKQLSRIKRMMSLSQKSQGKQQLKSFEEQQNDICASPLLSVINQSRQNQKRDSSFETYSKQEKAHLLTTYNFSKGSQQYKVHSRNYNKKQSILNEEEKGHQRLKKLQTVNSKARQDQFQDFINEIKVKGQFRMTKVLFGRDGKLQLSPNNEIKNNNENRLAAGVKNKLIFRKVQQNIRKKLNRITTEPPNQSINEKSPPSMSTVNNQERRTQICTQPSEVLKKANQKKTKRFTWKDKQIKFLGIKGVNSNNSFSDSNNRNQNNIPYRNFSNSQIQKSFLLGNNRQTVQHTSYFQ